MTPRNHIYVISPLMRKVLSIRKLLIQWWPVQLFQNFNFRLKVKFYLWQHYPLFSLKWCLIFKKTCPRYSSLNNHFFVDHSFILEWLSVRKVANVFTAQNSQNKAAVGNCHTWLHNKMFCYFPFHNTQYQKKCI